MPRPKEVFSAVAIGCRADARATCTPQTRVDCFPVTVLRRRLFIGPITHAGSPASHSRFARLLCPRVGAAFNQRQQAKGGLGAGIQVLLALMRCAPSAGYFSRVLERFARCQREPQSPSAPDGARRGGTGVAELNALDAHARPLGRRLLLHGIGHE